MMIVGLTDAWPRMAKYFLIRGLKIHPMPETISCYYLESPNIDNAEIQRILREQLDGGAGSLFLIDRVAILRGKMSTKAYGELSKFFDLHVMCYPRNTGQLQDVLISGAVSVVIPPSLPYKTMQQMAWLTEEIVFPYSTFQEATDFEKVGGTRYLTRGPIPASYTSLYCVGIEPPNDKAIALKGFPDEINKPDIF